MGVTGIRYAGIVTVRRGVLMFLTGSGFIKIVPPLTIDGDAPFEAVGVIGEAIGEVLGEYA